MKITTEDAANALNGGEYLKEGNPELFASMKEAGLVAVFGASDDLIEFRGAIDDEFGHGYVPLSGDGLLENKCDDCHCPYFKKLLSNTPYIVSTFSPDNVDTCWIYETNIPHSKFHIFEDGRNYCHGIVFDLGQLQ